MAQKTVEQFINHLRRLERNPQQGMEALVLLFTEDAELQNLASPWPLRGRAGTWRFWRDYVAAFQKVETQFTRVRDADSWAVLEWVASALLPSGKPMTYRGVTLLEMQGDSIRSLRSYYDSAAFLPMGAKHHAA